MDPSKYHLLRDVDPSQPDSFETHGGPNDEDKDNNNGVEVVSLRHPPRTAVLEVFGGRTYEPHKEESFQSTPGLLPVFEAPGERLKRLRREAYALQSELEALADVKKQNEIAGVVPTSSMADELSLLQVHLQDLIALGKGGYDDLKAASTAGSSLRLQGDMGREIVGVLEGFDRNGDGVTYEKIRSGKGPQGVDSAKAGELERRLAGLEAAVGRRDPTSPYTDLMSSLEAVRQTLENTKPAKLEKAKGRVAGLIPLLDRVLEAQKKLSFGDMRSLESVFETMDRWDALADVLPVLVTRLQALNALNEDCETLPARLGHLEEGLGEITGSLMNLSQRISDAEGSFREKAEVIKQNVHALETQFRQVAKKVPQ